MNLIKLTDENAYSYIGFEIIFKRRNGDHMIRRINRVSNTGKTVYINYPETKDNLQTGRNIYVIIP